MEGNKVNSKLLLLTLVLVLIVLLILNYVLSNLRSDNIWNYRKITSAEDIMYQGTVVSDRTVYYNLESIIKKYIDSYIPELSDYPELSYKDYYKHLTDNYKKYLSKKKYNEVAEKFLKKFYCEVEPFEGYSYMDSTTVIKGIREFDNNIYLCELESETNKITGYIAIQMDLDLGSYYIVYIE